MRVALPSPSLVISCIALGVSLGGTAVAEQRSEPRVRAAATQTASKVIRPGTLTERQVRRSALTGRSIRKDSLTGADVDETTLGVVPFAAAATAATRSARADTAGDADRAATATHAVRAESATSADTARRADVATVAERLASDPAPPRLVRVARGGVAVLATHGPLQLVARCLTDGAATEPVVFLDATADDQVYSSQRSGSNPDFDASDPLVRLTNAQVAQDADSPRLDGWEQANGFTLYDPATGAITAQGDLLAGARIFPAGAPDCVFGVRSSG